MNNIYENIRKIRTIKGLSQQNMSDDLGISQRHYGRIEKGEVDVNYSILCKIAKILDVKIVHLIGMDEMLIFNNYNQPQKDGHFTAYNGTEIDSISKLYERIIKEKDTIIFSLNDLVNSNNELIKVLKKQS